MPTALPSPRRAAQHPGQRDFRARHNPHGGAAQRGGGALGTLGCLLHPPHPGADGRTPPRGFSALCRIPITPTLGREAPPRGCWMAVASPSRGLLPQKPHTPPLMAPWRPGVGPIVSDPMNFPHQASRRRPHRKRWSPPIHFYAYRDPSSSLTSGRRACGRDIPAHRIPGARPGGGGGRGAGSRRGGV